MTDFFEGSISEIKFWNYAKSAEEIEKNYYKELTGNETGLMGYWKLNEKSGNVAIDSSKYKNNGTIYNGKWGVR